MKHQLYQLANGTVIHLRSMVSIEAMFSRDTGANGIAVTYVVRALLGSHRVELVLLDSTQELQPRDMSDDALFQWKKEMETLANTRYHELLHLWKEAMKPVV